MMLAASGTLVVEGFMFDEDKHVAAFSAPQRVLAGAVCGVLFVCTASQFLDQFEDVKLLDFKGRCLNFLNVWVCRSFC
jgi:hypothetical protein